MLLALMLILGMSLAQQTTDLQSTLVVRTSPPAPDLMNWPRSIATPCGLDAFSSRRLNLRDAIIVSEDIEKLNRKKESKDGRRFSFSPPSVSRA